MQNHPEVIDLAHPVHVVEMGSGHGKFGFLFVKQLEQLRAEFPTIAAVKIKYVMTGMDLPCTINPQFPCIDNHLMKCLLRFHRHKCFKLGGARFTRPAFRLGGA